MTNEIFSNISKIIERDSKTTTYKYALLRGVMDIIQDNSPFMVFSKDRIYFPTGLLIEKWMLYYYPILESSTKIPQIKGEKKLAFENQFKKLISEYTSIGGFSAFYNDLKSKGIPKHLQTAFLNLAKKMTYTITEMPMRYIGRSISNDPYSIFQFETGITRQSSTEIDIEFLISCFGTFSIPTIYYEAFKVLGSFISGQDSILFKWAEFSVNASGKNLSIEKVIHEVLKNPITEREINASKKIYENVLKNQKFVECVWTGEKITSYDVDHVIPFSVWKNNDLWNLLPSKPKTNNQKRDKIPSSSFIESRKSEIIHYWNLINENQTQRFQKEIRVALLGNSKSVIWQNVAIKQLQSSCNYLISNRGYEEWKI
jgi:hypothetical protein